MNKLALLIVVALAGCGGTSPPLMGDTLAPAGNVAASGPVDGIRCEATEQLVLHVHSHLTIYDHGVQKYLPPEIGITDNQCFSWLHTHDSTGIIHIESPIQMSFTLGEFFDIWGQPLDATQVGPAQGAVTAYADGAIIADPRTLPLGNHNVLQLDVGDPVEEAQPYTFPAGY